MNLDNMCYHIQKHVALAIRALLGLRHLLDLVHALLDTTVLKVFRLSVPPVLIVLDLEMH